MDRYLDVDDRLAHPQRWCQPGSNIMLDFHGDPADADLVIFSDGNHHMALSEALALFQKQVPRLKGVFYATTPPGPIVNLLKKGRLQLGKKFTDEENAKIVSFLKTLTGDQPSFLMPILPPSTDNTPPPKPFG